MGLSQRERFKHLIECAESTWKEHDGGRTENKMKLSYRKIFELKAELGGDEWVGLLLGRQLDVEANRLAANIKGPTIGSFHDAWSATCDDDVGTFVLALVVD